MLTVLTTLMLGAFTMPDAMLPEVSGEAADSALAALPHTDTYTERLLVRGDEPVREDAVVRAGGYYRYALDLYLLDKNHYTERIADNLDALVEELTYIGDQGDVTVDRRVEEVYALKKAISDGVPQDSVLDAFAHLDSEVRTLVGEYRPNGVHAYDLGNWITAIGVRVAFYPGCADETCRALVLSNVNLLIEHVERDDSEHWNAVLLAIPLEEIRMDDLLSSIEFLSGLPFYPIITGGTLDELLLKLHVVYKVFNLRFVA